MLEYDSSGVYPCVYLGTHKLLILMIEIHGIGQEEVNGYSRCHVLGIVLFLGGLQRFGKIVQRLGFSMAVRKAGHMSLEAVGRH